MTAKQYLHLEYHVSIRLAAVVDDIRKQGLAPNTEYTWSTLMHQARHALAVEEHELEVPEYAELLRQRRLLREDADYKAKLAKKRGRGAFGDKWTGD